MLQAWMEPIDNIKIIIFIIINSGSSSSSKIKKTLQVSKTMLALLAPHVSLSSQMVKESPKFPNEVFNVNYSEVFLSRLWAVVAFSVNTQRQNSSDEGSRNEGRSWRVLCERSLNVYLTKNLGTFVDVQIHTFWSIIKNRPLSTTTWWMVHLGSCLIELFIVAEGNYLFISLR